MSGKDQYIEKAKARLQRWNAEIEKIKAKADTAGVDAKIAYQEQLKDMHAWRDESEAALRELQAANDAAPADTKSGFAGAWESFSNSWSKAEKCARGN